MTQIKPFQIQASEEVLRDLRERLARTRWPSHPPGIGWAYGADVDYLKSLRDYWLNAYDWRAREYALNELPHFKTTIDGMGIHFVHVRCGAPDALPLVLVHGWPSSYLEMSRLIPLLTRPDENGRAFDVIIPSVPGYGFSDWPQAPGFGYRNAAVTITKLVRDVLGYRRMGLHGSDVGGFIIGWMGLQDKDGAVAGVHTMQAGTPLPDIKGLAQEFSPVERKYLDGMAAWEAAHGAYAHLQRTKPQTLAVGLNDSPMGLCAWIVDKLRTWSDCDGDVERSFSRDDILDLTMIYWIADTAPSSLRSYYERVNYDPPLQRTERIQAPAAVTVPIDRPGQPPHSAPREFTARIYSDVVQWTDLQRGGHFASWEEPEAVAAAMRKFFNRAG